MTNQQTIEDLLARLERERMDADRLYNSALTAVDRALQSVPLLPPEPGDYDATRLPDVNATWNTLANGAPTFDSSIKGRLARFVWRLVGPSLEQQQRFNSAVADHLNRNLETEQRTSAALRELVRVVRRELEALVRFESLLVQFLQTITVYVDTKDRSAGGPEIKQRLALTEQRLQALKRDLDAVVGRGASAPAAVPVTQAASEPAFSGPVDSLTYVAFEDQFRGTPEVIRRRVADYVPLFAGSKNVVDVGCGRGELLDALRTSGVSARGVDINPAMVHLCRSRGFDAEQGDALAFLIAQTDGTVGGLIAIQVVEHFTAQYLTRFLEAAYHAMQPGAPIVLETINPNCWMAFFETYIRDPTHQHPLHPDTLRHLVQSAGFTAVDVQFRQPVSDEDKLVGLAASGELSDPRVEQIIDALNDHAAKLNRRLFSSMDYVVIGRR